MPRRIKHPSPALPGLETIAIPSVRPADVDMTDERVYTAGALFRNHPDVFKAAATMLFKYLDSERKISEVLRLSTNTVRAIRDMVIEGSHGDAASAAAFLIKSKAANARKTIQLRALEAIKDRLDDPEESKKIGIETLISVSRFADVDEPKKDDAKRFDVTVVDVDEFDDILNGLDGEKKRSLDCGSDDGLTDADSHDPTTVQKPAECSTESDSTDVRSFELSGSNQCFKGVSGTLCNSLCNSSADVRSCSESVGSVGIPGDSVACAPGSSGVRDTTPGVGGRPGTSARGGSD